jgi:alpha-mannosidase
VGWLKTVDEYYSGANNSIQHASVRSIIGEVVSSLQKDPSRQFTYVEQAFFQRWWREQDAATRAVTQKLVANKQLTFVNGGWCMHDEAATHYVGMVDQTTLGHKFLKEQFGADGGVPTVGWQLDPFGHSATQAALLSADAGMDALYFGRIDYQDLKLRVNQSRAEFVWRASPSLGPSAQVLAGLTGEYGGNYGPPSGFNFDAHNGNDEPVETNPKLKTFNVKTRVDQFVAKAQEQANHTRGSNIMMTMGSDFNYENAEYWFLNLDKLIAACNADGRVRAFYSNPAQYTAAKRAEVKAGTVELPLVAGDNADFFPYADGPHQVGRSEPRRALWRLSGGSLAALWRLSDGSLTAL